MFGVEGGSDRPDYLVKGTGTVTECGVNGRVGTVRYECLNRSTEKDVER